MPNRHREAGPDYLHLGLPLLLRALRSSCALSQREFAGRAGLQKSTITRIEAGKNLDPLLSTLQRVTAAADYRLAVVSRNADLSTLASHEVTASDIPGIERYSDGRHFPAHLERRALDDCWWGWGRIAWEGVPGPRPRSIYFLRREPDD